IDPGEGVFYGPKIDIKVKDVLGRPWQCSTIQVDFNNPERFELTYRGSDGKEHRPIMIHRALMGSLERFFGILIEHYAGLFPLWLSPIQVGVLSIAQRHADYALEIKDKLLSEGMRALADIENEKIGAKIRKATLSKIPYIFIVGDREVESKTVSVRKHDGTNLGSMSIEDIIKHLKEEIRGRR
ncbi:MAG: threonine--tRNA ligase, partial [Nitrospirae bacterium]